jgi:hypothetical protein
MSALAVIRPDEWNLALFVHVLGAFTLVGALAVAASFLFAARGENALTFTRLGFRSLLLAALPAFLVTRIGAQWIASEEGVEDSDATWITIGFISTDVGLLALLGATVAAWLGVRRASREDSGGPGRRPAIAAWLVAFLLAVYAVVIWTMATKPA